MAGIVVALAAPQIGADGRGLATLAELGVALLMFVIGVEISLPQFLGLGRTVIEIAVLQILLTVGLGILLGSAFGYGTIAALALGFAMALSSTAVVLKSLEEHGQAPLQNSTSAGLTLKELRRSSIRAMRQAWKCSDTS